MSGSNSHKRIDVYEREHPGELIRLDIKKCAVVFSSFADRLFRSIRILHPPPCHRFDARTRGKSRSVVEATRRADVAVTQIDGLVSAVNEIDKVASMIHAIASQTNLLALNANIEAARAGEAGRRFAVVAQEVKLLAAQTTQALANIKAKTGSVGTIIDGVRDATQSMSTVVTQIDVVARATTDSVSLQSQATHKIAETVDSAATRTRQVSSSIAGVTDFANRTQLGAQQILQAVADLNRQAEALQVEAQEFVAHVRPA